MAKLGPYFGTHTGDLKIYVDSFEAGSGSFNAFSDFEAEFAGTYQIFFYSGSLNIVIKLNDNNPTSPSGSCRLTLNDKTDAAATYRVDGQKLTLTTTLNDGPIDLYGSQGGTQIDGISGHKAWIGQSG
jgi:hypothetical protein